MNIFLPMTEVTLKVSLELFTKIGVITTTLISAVFILRIVFLNIMLSSPTEYAETLKDLVLFFSLILLFPELIKLIMFSCQGIAEKIGTLPAPPNPNPKFEFLETLAEKAPGGSLISVLSEIAIIRLAQSIYSILLSIFIASSPIFIFLATILKFHGGIKSLFSILISLSLWPVLWSIIGQLGSHLESELQGSMLTTTIYNITTLLLQLLSPLFSFMFFKNLSTETHITKLLPMKRMMK